jgi:hypothetical protein
MTEIILQVIMIACAIALGYGIRALHKPIPKRGKGGRFEKRK